MPGNNSNKKIRDVLVDVTGGRSYKAHKYSLDADSWSPLDYETPQIRWKKTAETTNHKKHVDLREQAAKIGSQPQLLTYFLDGSRHVYKVDDFAYPVSGGRNVIYPIIAGQIGVGCCKRENKRVALEHFQREIVLSVPDIADADGKNRGFWSALVIKLNECSDLQRAKLEFSAVLPYKTSKDEAKYEDKATATVQDRMIEKEKALVAELVGQGKLNSENYLVKDGSLEYRITDELKKDSRKYKTFKHNYTWVIGASKTFNAEVCLDMNGKPNPGFIADLPLYHRTPVACYENDYIGDVQFAVWYVRIRDQKQTRSPFDGILKIEKILVTDEEINEGMDSELVDLLSALIINERNPVCYGSDNRWANHLYPIYLTEQFVKSRYISAESFLHLF